jgi:CheY-like chemotaxis protein
MHTLLFVDDEPSILHALRRLFRREDYQVLTATSGREGLELLKENEVSLIISDQRMPQMIGAEFLAHARTLSPHSIRIMLTGYSDIEAATQAINEGGIFRYITKPWKDEQLKTTVREGLERYELEDRNRKLTAELQLKNAELEQFNVRLEQKVEERTQELRIAYEENLELTRSLQMKVRELEGKDRIAQHLLTVHSLEETLELILDVIAGVLGMDRAIIYLKKEDETKPVAGIGVDGTGSISTTDQLIEVGITPIQQQAFDTVEATLEPTSIANMEGSYLSSFAVVPILRGDELLGLIEVSKQPPTLPIADEELQTLASFALQSAVAVSDAQVHHNFDIWQDRLDTIMGDVEELEELIS